MVGWVRDVFGGGHEEGGGCAEGDDGVEGAEWKCEDSGGIVACEGGDSAGGGEVVSLYEVGGDGAHAAASVFADGAELLLEGVETVFSSGELEERFAPGSCFDIPEIHTAHITDVKGGDLAQEDGSEE